MCTSQLIYGETLRTWGDRLREERERMKLSQMAFAEMGGVQKRTQINYEQEGRYPDMAYLVAIAAFGVDIQYIVTGVRSTQALNDDEKTLLELFRSAPLTVKAAAIGALQGGGNVAGHTAGRDVIGGNKTTRKGDVISSGGKSTVTIHGNVGQQIKGTVVHTGPVTMGGKKKNKE